MYEDMDMMFTNNGIYGLLAILGGIILVVALIVLILGVLTYVFSSVGLYTIAKRRGIRHAWMAWIPVANKWILGSVSDQYQYVTGGKVRYNRIILVALAVLSCVMSGVSTESVWAAVEGVAALGTLSAGLVTGLISIAGVVFHFMALYDLYRSCNPGSSTVFLVLSIIFRITEPFFVFSCRNKDLGMPPRKTVDAPKNE